MSQRPLLVSALVFSVLAVAAFWVLRDREPPPPEPFFALKRANPDTLIVVYAPDTTVVVAGGPTGWSIVRPVRDSADAIVVDALLQRLRNLAVGRTFPVTEEKIDTYGLRFPRAVIRASYDDGREPDTLIVGAFTMNAAFDYVRNGSGPEVALLDARTTRGYLFKSPFDLRETRFLAFHESRGVGYRARAGDGTILAEIANDPWRVVRPYPGPVAAEKVRAYFGSLSHMEIEAFLAETLEDPGACGLDPPALTAEVARASGDTLVVDLGSSVPGEPWVHARIRGRPQLLAVSAKYLPVLARTPDALREPRVLDFGIGDVDSVAGPGGTWTAGAWTGVETRDTPIRGILENWITLEARGFRPASDRQLGESGLSGPAERLVWYGGGDTLAVVVAGSGRGGAIPLWVPFGRAARRDEILLVPEDPGRALWRALAEGPPGG